jgi:hypothetical protein
MRRKLKEENRMRTSGKAGVVSAWAVVLGTTMAAGSVHLGANASIGGRRLLPRTNPWNRDISSVPVDPRSSAIIAAIGADTPLHPDFGARYNGIPYMVVSGSQPKVPVTFRYNAESDHGLYPIPPNAPIEGGPQSTTDRHVLILDKDHWKLYELYDAHPIDGGKRWLAGSGAIFDLRSNNLRRAGFTSADAAGLPILPGLVRYDEVVEQGAIQHALRCTVAHSRRAYVYPARHFASPSTDPDLPPMGMRLRLKASYDISSFPPAVQVILRALKHYGMIVADNGGNLYIPGASDPRWDDEAMSQLRRVRAQDFEVVKMGQLITH